MTIDLVDNNEHFKDVYPSDPDDSETFDSDSSAESETEPHAAKDLALQIKKLEISVKEATEERNSAQGRLNMLDNYARSLTTSRPDDIAACVGAYQAERAKAFESHRNGESKLEEHQGQVNKLKNRRQKLLRKEQRRKWRLDRVKSKDQDKKQREKQLKVDEKKRLRRERTQFWPKKVYKVVLCLDANSGMTPTSSRRGSIDSLQKLPTLSHPNAQDKSDSQAADIPKVDLSFSYITHSASWSPRYDLALDTTSKSGSITYRAEFRNRTSETWCDTKVVLSTSQTSFQGLGESIPQIQPWHIRLAKGFGQYATDDALFSRSELDSKNTTSNISGQKPQAPRNQLFGQTIGSNEMLNGASRPQNLFGGPPKALPAAGSASSLCAYLAASNANQGGSQALGSGGGLFGASNNVNVRQRESTMANAAAQPFGMVQAQPNIFVPHSQQAQVTEADELGADLDTETIAAGDAVLAFEESTWEEAGLTATYTVPGTKTIAPSNTTRRYKVASIPLSSIALSHIVVPKLRTAAFLKARLRNTSSTTLLRGPVGLTLDGTFLGNTTLPRSSPGEAFVLNLGVDPALNVVYSKPTVRRSQTGVFQKEGSQTYARSCTLTNTKNNTVIEATVLDQVPVSEDDKLKVEVLVPRGLRKNDDQGVKAGVGQINEGTGKKGSTYAEQGAAEEKAKWGKATAKMRKEGEIEWDVKLNPGQGVKLELEYEARFPGGEGIVVV